MLKADQAGERLPEKNLYANPTDWTLCVWTSPGIWCSPASETSENNDQLFLKSGAEEGSAAQRYGEQLVAVVKPHMSELMTHIEKAHFHPYGLRKGAATHSLGGTTCAPSIPSVARRGEWSIGSVLDCYWHFGSTRDQFLGQILAGLDPNNCSFDLLPPHWNIVNPMTVETISEGME